MTIQSDLIASKRERLKLVIHLNLCINDLFIEKKRLEKREKLHVKEQQIKTQISSKVQALHDSSSLVIEGLPKNYN
jgi:hypothetical protein